MQKTTSSKPATLRDVARVAGISPATASLALNGKTCIAPKTRELVIQTAQELGYEADFFAQSLRRRVSPQIGVFTLSLDLGIGTQLLRRIQDHLQARGFEVPIHGYGFSSGYDAGEQAALMGRLSRLRPRAIICHTANLHESALRELARYVENGGSVVSYDFPTDFSCDQVVFDHENYTYASARHLLELGHRDLGLFLEGPHQTHDPLHNAMMRGFRRALQEWEVPCREDWLWHGSRTLGAEQDGEEFAMRFLSLRKRPSGMCIVSDNAALAFVSTIQQHGLKVPHHVSVVGHGDRPVAPHAAVPLTSVSYPVEAIAQSVVELLENRLHHNLPRDTFHDEDNALREVLLQGELIVRQSTVRLQPA
jgi:DNA-binding LacI/PurR family transcriptional regulator